MTSDAARFPDLMARAVERTGTLACVGIDPVLERLPATVRTSAGDAPRALASFSRGVVEAVADVVPAVKLQSACFERYGAPGWAALELAGAEARERGLLVILDAKRGDIGISATHYAAAAAALGAHALTVNAYLGPETVEPYLEAGLGVFVLVRTSNPDSDAVQSSPLEDGRTVAEMMADLVTTLGASRRGERGLSDVGAVVAATKPADAASLRARMPDTPFLVPGFGAQGGSSETIRGLRRPAGDGGLLVSASRSVIYPDAARPDTAGRPVQDDWREQVRAAARSMAASLQPRTDDRP